METVLKQGLPKQHNTLLNHCYKYRNNLKLSGKKKVLLFYNYLSSFVKKDINILSSSFNVESNNFYSPGKLQMPLKWLAQCLFLARYIWGADLIICQFAGYHSLLPVIAARLLRRPCLVIVGGTDAHYFPGIGYGNWQKRFLKTFTSLTFKWCTHIAPKHKTLMEFNYTYDSTEPQQQGIYARLPKLKTPFTEITNGYDAEKWGCNAEKKENTFLTITLGWEYSFQYALKGIDLIIAVAPFFPHCTFTILGVPNASYIQNAPLNVKLLPPQKNETLAAVCSEHQFYLQLSMAEGFPNSICEAMLCECVPIGSAVFSIPEIIGNTGFVLQHRNIDELKSVIQKALNTNSQKELGKRARERIAVNYTQLQRQGALLKLCYILTKNKIRGK